MKNSIMFDNEDFPVYISGNGESLSENDWIVHIYRDSESVISIPKSSFTPDNNGVYSYTIPKSQVGTLAKGLYSVMLVINGENICLSNKIALKKGTRL